MSRERLASLVIATIAFTALALVPSAHAAFPGANGKIAFVNSTAAGDAIFTVNPDGSGLLQLTSNAQGDREPGWSADGARIVFARNLPSPPSGRSQVWVMNADGSGLAQLTSGIGDCDPAFLPDGRVVFVRSPSFCPDPDSGDIWIRNLNGSEVNLTSTAQLVELTPTSSPDGARIAFAQGIDAIEDTVIVTIPSGGGAPTPVTNDHGSELFLDTSPNYSPEGATIAFDRCPGGEGCFGLLNLYRVPAGGGATTAMTSNVDPMTDPDACDPAYAPDGSRLVFTRLTPMFTFSNCDPTSANPVRLSFIAPSGGAVQDFMSGFSPDWQPVAAAGSTTSCYGRTATIVGTGEDDKIVGTPEDDVIKGKKGDDVIKGKKGDDILCGQRGDDRLFGGRGDDILIGGKANDFLKGGPGVDQIFGGTPDAKNKPQVKDICIFSEEDKTNNCKRPD